MRRARYLAGDSALNERSIARDWMCGLAIPTRTCAPAWHAGRSTNDCGDHPIPDRLYWRALSTSGALRCMTWKGERRCTYGPRQRAQLRWQDKALPPPRGQVPVCTSFFVALPVRIVGICNSTCGATWTATAQGSADFGGATGGGNRGNCGSSAVSGPHSRMGKTWQSFTRRTGRDPSLALLVARSQRTKHRRRVRVSLRRSARAEASATVPGSKRTRTCGV